MSESVTPDLISRGRVHPQSPQSARSPLPYNGLSCQRRSSINDPQSHPATLRQQRTRQLPNTQLPHTPLQVRMAHRRWHSPALHKRTLTMHVIKHAGP